MPARRRHRHPLRQDVPRTVLDGVPYRSVSSLPVPVLIPDAPVTVEWDPTRNLYAAVCQRCTDQTDALALADAHDWATGHHCDPELAALLAQVTSGVAA